MLGMAYFLALVAIAPLVAEAVDQHDLRRLRSGHVQAKSIVASNSSQESLEALAGGCRCSFSGLCSCVQALEFMNCMRDACDSGACDCQKHHYLYACHTMSAECPSAGLKCGVSKASCKKVPPMVTESSMELVSDIQVMQARKCKLKEAVADGWINGRLRIEELEPEIQDRVETLKGKGIQPPRLGCSREDAERFQEFKADLTEQMERETMEKEKQVKQSAHTQKVRGRKHREVQQTRKVEEKRAEGLWKEEDSPWKGDEAMPETDAELAESLQRGEGHEAIKGPHAAAHDVTKDAGLNSLRSRLWKLSWLSWISIVLVDVAIAVLFAWLYNRQRLRPTFPLKPKEVAIIQREKADLGVPFFGCFQDLKLCLFSFCCPCLRWADTMDRTGLLRYWPAFAVFFGLSILSSLTYGIAGFVLVLVCFFYRQKLRKLYGVDPNLGQDFCAYLCCSPCAIIQEARVVSGSTRQ